MAELNSKRRRKDTAHEDQFQEVCFPFDSPRDNENNDERDEFKEVSIPLKVMDSTAGNAQSQRPSMKRLMPSTSRTT